MATPSTTSTSLAARRQLHGFWVRIGELLLVVIVLVMGAGLALSFFEDRSFWYSINWAFDMVVTTGSAGQPGSAAGLVTKFLLMIVGLGTVVYLLSTVTELFVAGELSGLLEFRRQERKIRQLSDHYIICGFGRVGRQVARDLEAAGAEFVVVEDDPRLQERIDEYGVLHVEGKGYEDETLQEAGIERARALIACVDSDAQNIFITLTARELRPDIRIIARASESSESRTEHKLVRAGANFVISPYKTAGEAMARFALTDG